MTLENRVYLVIGTSVAFFLFGFAVVINLFSLDNTIAVIVTVLLCTGLSILAALYINAEIDPVEISKKGKFIGICIVVTLSLFALTLSFILFPGDLVALLINLGISTLLSLISIYISMSELEPLMVTSKTEVVIFIIIFLIGIVVSLIFFLDNMVGLLLTVGLCLLVYFFIFLAIEFYKKAD